LGQDPQLIQEMLQCFVESAPELMAQIHPALAQKDSASLQASLHAYKGVAANLSAEALAEQLQVWEKHLKTHEQVDWPMLEGGIATIQQCHEETLQFLGDMISQ
jgi:HPt (histidine-containing phosphotransfer) domain-containing protein